MTGMISWGFACWLLLGLPLYVSSQEEKCPDDELAIFSLAFEANWTRHNFPKQYPDWRPPAQWSNLIGMSHNEEYTLFRLGETAGADFKMFAETGKVNLIASQNFNTEILDEFYGPPLKSGTGKTGIDFMADGHHSLVSFAIRIIPSPDWFLGVDSVNLCSEGRWRENITVEASPLDAGTDSGFTFTAPNWKTEPPERIFQITARYPNHPANSFYYPHLPSLPVIAKFSLQKKKTYRLKSFQVEGIKIKDEISCIMHQEANSEHNEIVEVRYKKSRKNKKREKCKVSNWSEWSNCNATCGVGFAIRIRNVTSPVRHGQKCPNLKEEKRCNEYLDCSKDFFKW